MCGRKEVRRCWSRGVPDCILRCAFLKAHHAAGPGVHKHVPLLWGTPKNRSVLRTKSLIQCKQNCQKLQSHLKERYAHVK